LFSPTDPIQVELKNRLLKRVPLRLVHEVRFLQEKNKDKSPQPDYLYLSHLPDNQELKNALESLNLTSDYVCIALPEIKFEGVAYSRKYNEPLAEEDRLKLVKIKTEEGSEDLISFPSSLLSVLSNYESKVARLYGLVSIDQGKRLKETVDQMMAKHMSQA